MWLLENAENIKYLWLAVISSVVLRCVLLGSQKLARDIYLSQQSSLFQKLHNHQDAEAGVADYCTGVRPSNRYRIADRISGINR
jgi:hypothetical protein